jgi:hypothetical protein
MTYFSLYLKFYARTSEKTPNLDLVREVWGIQIFKYTNSDMLMPSPRQFRKAQWFKCHTAVHYAHESTLKQAYNAFKKPKHKTVQELNISDYTGQCQTMDITQMEG